MREVTLFLPEERARVLLEAFEGFPTLVVLSAIASDHPTWQQRIDLLLPDASYNELMAILQQQHVYQDGVILTKHIHAVDGARAEQIKRAIGHEEAEAIAWEEVAQALERDSMPGAAFMLFIGLASVIAVSALIVGSIPILIGAMVIPPALSALTAIPIALLLGRWKLLGQGMLATFLTLLLGVVFSWVAAFLLLNYTVIPSDGALLRAEIVQERTQVGFYAYLVALAAGIAGGLSTVTNRPSQLVGVMIAAAIIPSAATVGLGLAQQDPGVAFGALELLGVNVGLIIFGGFLAGLGARLIQFQRWLHSGTSTDRARQQLEGGGE
jgi:uncharacterized hydrophobic protein (TIGR00341 family)